MTQIANGGENARVIQFDIKGDSGDRTVKDGDWVLLSADGKVYPCGPEVFAQIYEPA